MTSMPEAWARELSAELTNTDTIFVENGASDRSVDGAQSKLTGLFGLQGYDYIGGGPRDLPACKSARRATLVTSNRSTISQAKQISSIDTFIPSDKARISTFLKMIRVHQWLKNLLILVPLLAAHRLTSFDNIGCTAALGFPGIQLLRVIGLCTKRYA